MDSSPARHESTSSTSPLSPRASTHATSSSTSPASGQASPPQEQQGEQLEHGLVDASVVYHFSPEKEYDLFLCRQGNSKLDKPPRSEMEFYHSTLEEKLLADTDALEQELDVMDAEIEQLRMVDPKAALPTMRAAAPLRRRYRDMVSEYVKIVTDLSRYPDGSNYRPFGPEHSIGVEDREDLSSGLEEILIHIRRDDVATAPAPQSAAAKKARAVSHGDVWLLDWSGELRWAWKTGRFYTRGRCFTDADVAELRRKTRLPAAAGDRQLRMYIGEAVPPEPADFGSSRAHTAEGLSWAAHCLQHQAWRIEDD